MQVKEKERVPGPCMGEGASLVIQQEMSVEHLP